MTDFLRPRSSQDNSGSSQFKSPTSQSKQMMSSLSSSETVHDFPEYTQDASQYLSSYYVDKEIIKANTNETHKLSVWKVHQNNWVSIKIVNRAHLTFDSEMFFVQEVNILKDLQHPNIIQLVDCVIYPNSYSVVYEHFTGQDLIQKIANRKSYNELQARNWIQGIFDAVKFCHERNIIHRYALINDLVVYHVLFIVFIETFVRETLFS
jgi:hypothetical protein